VTTKPVIYFRGALAEEREKEAASKHFRLIERRTLVQPGDLVIPRYSALPYNKELQQDVEELGATLINTYQQHCYVADIRNWYYDLADLTPRTWFSLDQIPQEGPFILKGATNSKKFLWDTHMFARNKREAGEVFCRLSQDSNVGVQPIYVREYVPLHRLEMGLNGLPISEEYRFFVLDGEVMGAGFYWSSHIEDLDRAYDPFTEVPPEFIKQVVDRVSGKIRFWVFDVARRVDGGWLVVELNDGQQSGLSEVDPDVLYANMHRWLVQCV
jgi:hypothetical protein